MRKLAFSSLARKEMSAVRMSNLCSRQPLKIRKIMAFLDYSTLPMDPFIKEEKKSLHRSGFRQNTAASPGSQGVPQS